MGPTYHLVAHGVSEPVHVSSFRAREVMNEAYEASITCSADAARDLASELLGRRATLVLNVADQPEVIHGVVHSVGLADYATTAGGSVAVYSVTLAPRFWLLKKRRRSRVFRGKRVDEIVKDILDVNRIPSLWALQRQLPVRDYCTQYEETDEEFIRRVLAEAGVMFYFLQPSLPAELAGASSIIEMVVGALSAIPALGDFIGGLGLGSVTGEVMVFADDALAYYGIGDAPEGLEGLLQSAVGRAGSEIAAATGEAGGAVVSAVRDLAALGIAELGTSRALKYRAAGDAIVAGDRDVVRAFALDHTLVTESVTFSTFDPARPLTPLSFSTAGDRPLGALTGLVGQLPAEAAGIVGTAAQLVGTGVDIARAAGADTTEAAEALGVVDRIARGVGMAIRGGELAIHEHHHPFLSPDHADAAVDPRRILDGERRDRRVGRAVTLCPLVACGRRFTLADHPIGAVNREYVVTEVTHHGRSYDEVSTGSGATEDVYRNELRCVPSDVPYIPRRPRRRTVQTCLTATVIAPEHDAEMETHGMGEVKVRFHWEDADTGTCWVRTMQTLAGVGWGTQFLPRAGMEVVVGFDGGDPDRPIVLGCVYNAVHPAPFALPEHQTKSGIKTHSTPNGDGYNEVSFEDREGRERVFIHAERDFDVEVEHDRTAAVLNDDALVVGNRQRVVVRGTQETRVERGQDIHVRQHRRVEVDGNHDDITRGERQSVVVGSSASEVRGSRRSSCTGASSDTVGGDATRETKGSSTELVRKARVVRSEGINEISSAKANTITSDTEVILRCGQSSVRIASDCVEIMADEVKLAAGGSVLVLSASGITGSTDGAWRAVGATAFVASSGASVDLGAEATVTGSQVRLSSGSGADEESESETEELTIIELKDAQGRPVPRQRYRIELGDGTARTGNLDENGRAELRIRGSAEVVFPDLAEVNRS